jgi:hypothetical protein
MLEGSLLQAGGGVGRETTWGGAGFRCSYSPSHILPVAQGIRAPSEEVEGSNPFGAPTPI